MNKPKLKRYIQRMGCKQSIVFDILGQIINRIGDVSNLTFVDLFGGGGVVSSNATYFFKNVMYNEIDKGVHDLFIAAQEDEFLKKAKQRRVSREDFFNLDVNDLEDSLLKTAYSFGNNRRNYAYGKLIERKKELTHKIIFSKSEEEYKSYIKMYNEEKVATYNKYGGLRTCYLYDDDRIVFNKQKEKRYYKFGKKSNYYRIFEKEIDIELLKADRGEMSNPQDIKLIKDIESLQSLQSLQSLESLQSLQRLERLESYNLDYRKVVLPSPSNCIIYLDPPYRNTGGYETQFNFEEFDDYVFSLKEKGYKIFISEYNLPYGEVIRSKTKRGFRSQKKENRTGKENLYYCDN